MSLTFRKHYWLLISFSLVIIASLSIGSIRIISYNFGQGQAISLQGKNYDNEIYLFDDSQVHEIKIDLNEKDYDAMVQIYQETGAKDFFQTNITIDGVTVPNVGIRLKGNLTLRQTLGGNFNDQRMPGAVEKNRDAQLPLPENFVQPENMANMPLPPDLELPDNWDEMTNEERQIYIQNNRRNNFPLNGMGKERMGAEGNGDNPPFLIKTDEFITGQTYQNFSEIAIRLGSDQSLLAEPVSFFIHQQMGQIVPETAYAVVETAANKPNLYVICEHLDQKYIEKHFPKTDGILYKAGNFIGFEYLGEDPTLYADKYEQKTSINDDDLAPLIRFLKFVDESSDEEFENQLANWLDLDSFIRMMALDNLLDNNDSFVGMGSNYFLYYDKNKKQFTMLSWDMNLAMGSMGDMTRNRNQEDNTNQTESEQRRQEIFNEWLAEGGFNDVNQQNMNNLPGGGPGGRSSENTLKNRFFANEKFLQLYNDEYTRLEKSIFNENWVLEKVEQLAQVFTAYNENFNIIEQSEYDAGVTKITSYLDQKN